MKTAFSDRIVDIPKSFTREILKVTADRSIISFAGGLPNRDLFPSEELKKATDKVFAEFGSDIFQYSNSEGYLGLRKMISSRYHDKKHLDIPPENILITNGSQQGLDLIGKTFINEGDDIIIEEPGYFAAIQAFSVFRPWYNPVTLLDDGPDILELKSIMRSKKPKLMYTVPEFQNPSGISYSEEIRLQTANIIQGTDTLLVEDDPYSELRYSGTPGTSFKTWLPDTTILLGTFSKTVVPGFRLGWIAAPDQILDKLIIAKQAADLHTAIFTQCIVYQYLLDFDNDIHIKTIRESYGRQLRTMLNAMSEYFPLGVKFTHPEGGMFVWVTLPDHHSSNTLLKLASKQKVVFVPGSSFYTDKRDDSNTLRVNFTCESEETIREGVKRLSIAIKELINQ
jgi:2-aminoadipate transaminase